MAVVRADPALAGGGSTSRPLTLDNPSPRRRWGGIPFLEEDEMLHYSTLDTPTGPFTVVISDAGAVRAAGFTPDVDELLPLIHPQLVEDSRPVTDTGAVGAAVRSYLDGDLAAIDEVPVEQRIGGLFIA